MVQLLPLNIGPLIYAGAGAPSGAGGAPPGAAGPAGAGAAWGGPLCFLATADPRRAETNIIATRSRNLIFMVDKLTLFHVQEVGNWLLLIMNYSFKRFIYFFWYWNRAQNVRSINFNELHWFFSAKSMCKKSCAKIVCKNFNWVHWYFQNNMVIKNKIIHLKLLCYEIIVLFVTIQIAYNQ